MYGNGFGDGVEIHCGYMIPGNRPQIGPEMKGDGKNEAEDNNEPREEGGGGSGW